MAVVVSYGLTALGGYVMYRNAAGHSEEQLSAAVRFVISPLISLLIGGLVGLLSKSHPIPTCVIGLAPWAVTLLSPNKPASISAWAGWLVPILVYVPLDGVLMSEYVPTTMRTELTSAWRRRF
jgi:hypothetical protein